MKRFSLGFPQGLLILCFLAVNLSVRDFASANSEYEEISYEDLVQRLNSKKSRIRDHSATNPLDDNLIRAGFGIVSGLQTYHFHNQADTRNLSGFQISLGVDLFSRHWTAETVLRNQGNSSSMSLKETDVKILYREDLASGVGFHLGLGLTTRDLRVLQPGGSPLTVNASPSGMGSVALFTGLNRFLSLGIELSARSALVDETPDRWGADATLRLDSAF